MPLQRAEEAVSCGNGAATNRGQRAIYLVLFVPPQFFTPISACTIRAFKAMPRYITYNSKPPGHPDGVDAGSRFGAAASWFRLQVHEPAKTVPAPHLCPTAVTLALARNECTPPRSTPEAVPSELDLHEALADAR